MNETNAERLERLSNQWWQQWTGEDAAWVLNQAKQNEHHEKRMNDYHSQALKNAVKNERLRDILRDTLQVNTWSEWRHLDLTERIEKTLEGVSNDQTIKT